MKKINLWGLKEALSNGELRGVVGGKEYYGGTLPEVVLTCNQNGGYCWTCDYNPDQYYCRRAGGTVYDYCGTNYPVCTS